MPRRGRAAIGRALPLALSLALILIVSASWSRAAQDAGGKVVNIGMPDKHGLVRIENRGFVKWNARWPSYIIPVCWEDSDPSSSREREIVREAIQNSWERYSGLKFVNWGECGPFARGIRIVVDDENPRTLGLARELDGVPGGMLLNFTFRRWRTQCSPDRINCIKGIAVHEFGHAIGFSHEQNRPDTPNGCPGPQGSNGNWLLTPWDPSSVMNYCNPSNKGILSEGDIKSVGAMYP